MAKPPAPRPALNLQPSIDRRQPIRQPEGGYSLYGSNPARLKISASVSAST
jgi:hypothetical protein